MPKKAKKKIEEEYYAYCHKCQLKRGAKVPLHGMDGITVTQGTCPSCKKPKGLVPNSDYDWPEGGRRAIFD